MEKVRCERVVVSEMGSTHTFEDPDDAGVEVLGGVDVTRQTELLQRHELPRPFSLIELQGRKHRFSAYLI